jgi:hypothetical protein
VPSSSSGVWQWFLTGYLGKIGTRNTIDSIHRRSIKDREQDCDVDVRRSFGIIFESLILTLVVTIISVLV